MSYSTHNLQARSKEWCKGMWWKRSGEILLQREQGNNLDKQSPSGRRRVQDLIQWHPVSMVQVCFRPTRSLLMSAKQKHRWRLTSFIVFRVLKWLVFFVLFAKVKSKPRSSASCIRGACLEGKDRSVAPAQTCWNGKKSPSAVLATRSV
jgi:hypothetical protein